MIAGSSRPSTSGRSSSSLYPMWIVRWTIPVDRAEIVDRDGLVVRNARHRLGLDGHDQQALVSDLLIADVGM